MRRATNNSRGQRVKTTCKTKKGKTMPPLVAYILKDGSGRITATFNKNGGGLFLITREKSNAGKAT